MFPAAVPEQAEHAEEASVQSGVVVLKKGEKVFTLLLKEGVDCEKRTRVFLLGGRKC